MGIDVVHPGHVRHLTYENKADILAVSITADKYIEKYIGHLYQKI